MTYNRNVVNIALRKLAKGKDHAAILESLEQDLLLSGRAKLSTGLMFGLSKSKSASLAETMNYAAGIPDWDSCRS